MLIIQHKITTCSPNGDPRRVWDLFKADERATANHFCGRFAVVDEGYNIDSAARALKSLGLDPDTVEYVEIPSCRISPTEYNNLVVASERLDSRLPFAVVWPGVSEPMSYHRTKESAQRAARDYNRIFGKGSVEWSHNDPKPLVP